MASEKRWMKFDSSAANIAHPHQRVGRAESEGLTSKFSCVCSVLGSFWCIDK